MKNQHPVLYLFCKLALLASSFFLFFIVASLHTPAPQNLQHAQLQDKLQKILLDTSPAPQIIVSGDSRAQDNVVPAVLDKLSGVKSANVAVGYGLLAEEYDALAATNQLNKKRLIIVSVGIYDINDGGENADLSVINHEPWGIQKVSDIITYYATTLNYYFYRFGARLRFSSKSTTTIDPIFVETAGYAPQTAVFIPPQDGDLNPPGWLGWYTDVRLGGVNQQNFVHAIQELGNVNDTVVIYLGPVAPFAKTAMPLSNAWSTDQQLAALITKTIAPYKNISFINFETQDTSSLLTNDKFGDYFHLNESGAPIFTKMLYDELKWQHLLK